MCKLCEWGKMSTIFFYFLFFAMRVCVRAPKSDTTNYLNVKIILFRKCLLADESTWAECLWGKVYSFLCWSWNGWIRIFCAVFWGIFFFLTFLLIEWIFWDMYQGWINGFLAVLNNYNYIWPLKHFFLNFFYEYLVTEGG